LFARCRHLFHHHFYPEDKITILIEYSQSHGETNFLMDPDHEILASSLLGKSFLTFTDPVAVTKQNQLPTKVTLHVSSLPIGCAESDDEAAPIIPATMVLLQAMLPQGASVL
jgi:hypothetical protein